MNVERLIEMANDIGHYFEVEPQREDAVNGVLNHLLRFWDPRMRAQIAAHLEQTGGEGLDPVPREAVARLAARMQPTRKAS
ncbi:MAG: formate dehydrogenase subunit delta [Sinobacteraceae bacterium]|nr:formate dehydrogenase subunit delta [Nevskia sp.]MDI3259855.1 formate dehydrogenase subunit delta [Nevskiaceae bacterium]